MLALTSTGPTAHQTGQTRAKPIRDNGPSRRSPWASPARGGQKGRAAGRRARPIRPACRGPGAPLTRGPIRVGRGPNGRRRLGQSSQAPLVRAGGQAAAPAAQTVAQAPNRFDHCRAKRRWGSNRGDVTWAAAAERGPGLIPRSKGRIPMVKIGQTKGQNRPNQGSKSVGVRPQWAGTADQAVKHQ